MGHYVELQAGRSADLSHWTDCTSGVGPCASLTFAKEPRIAELMLFDSASLRAIAGWYDGGPGAFDLLSDREGAVARFQRRLPRICAALAWHPHAEETLTAFGSFFTTIDWPYLRLDTSDYRIVLDRDEQVAFDQELTCAVSALDQPAIAIEGSPFGGPGRYSSDWERLLNFCLRRGSQTGLVQAIYKGDDMAFQPLSGTADHWLDSNKPGTRLGAYLRGRDA